MSKSKKKNLFWNLLYLTIFTTNYILTFKLKIINHKICKNSSCYCLKMQQNILNFGHK